MNEQETTKALAVLGRIQEHLGITAGDKGLAAMTEDTDPNAVSSAIQHAVTADKPARE